MLSKRERQRIIEQRDRKLDRGQDAIVEIKCLAEDKPLPKFGSDFPDYVKDLTLKQIKGLYKAVASATSYPEAIIEEAVSQSLEEQVKLEQAPGYETPNSLVSVLVWRAKKRAINMAAKDSSKGQWRTCSLDSVKGVEGWVSEIGVEQSTYPAPDAPIPFDGEPHREILLYLSEGHIISEASKAFGMSDRQVQVIRNRWGAQELKRRGLTPNDFIRTKVMSMSTFLSLCE